MAAARAYLPRLLRRGVRHRDPSCLEAACFLATPPFALAAVSLLAGAAVAAAVGLWWLTVPFGAGLLTLCLALGTGLVQAKAGPRTWFALLAAPWYLAWKSVVQVRAILSLLRREDYYPPTERAGAEAE